MTEAAGWTTHSQNVWKSTQIVYRTTRLSDVACLQDRPVVSNAVAHDPNGDSDTPPLPSEDDLARWRQEVGDRVHAARQGTRINGRRVSQAMLAEGTGINRADISLLENGKRDPRLSTLLRIATFLGLPASELLPAEHQPPV